jgi:hypothetical protein
MDWWFKLAMCILIPTAAALAVACFVPLPQRKRDKKWGPREY